MRNSLPPLQGVVKDSLYSTGHELLNQLLKDPPFCVPGHIECLSFERLTSMSNFVQAPVQVVCRGFIGLMPQQSYQGASVAELFPRCPKLRA